MIRVAVCDDDHAFAVKLETHIQDVCDKLAVEVETDIFLDGRELLDTVGQGSAYDMAFLDIEMGLDGIETAKGLIALGRPPLLIYVSSYEQYLMDLFEVEPFRFLKKPVDIPRFEQVFKQAYERLAALGNFFWYKQNRETVWVPVGDILYFESRRRQVHIYTVDGQDAFYAKLDEVEARLCENNIPFLRIHKSFYVNFTHIQRLSFSYVILRTGQKLPISEERQKAIRDVCGTLIGGN